MPFLHHLKRFYVEMFGACQTSPFFSLTPRATFFSYARATAGSDHIEEKKGGRAGGRLRTCGPLLEWISQARSCAGNPKVSVIFTP